MGKVSVIVPVYNAGKNMYKCLDALLNQSFKDFEVICVDDGSKDNSYEILKQYAQKDDRIKVFTQENHGPAYTRHFAISQSRGEYLMFCDADDWYEPSMIEKMVNAIEKEDVDIAVCDTNIVNFSGQELNQSEKDHYYQVLKIKGKIQKLTPQHYRSINVVLWNKIFRKSIMEKYQIEYPQRYEHDDTMFFYKYIVQCKSYYGIDECLYNYVVCNPDSIMGKLISKNNKKNIFDFIYAWQDTIDYVSKMVDDKGKINFILHNNFGMIRHFFVMLDEQEQREAFDIIKKYISDNPFLLQNKNFKDINRISKVEDYGKFFQKEQISLLKKIFSIRNKYINSEKRKVITIFGFDIIIK